MGRFRSLRRCLLLTAVALISGCAIPLDLLNTAGLASTFGLDAFTVSQPQGSVIITFNNQTSLIASFRADYSDSAGDPASNVKTVRSDNLGAGEIRNRVVDCPIGIVTPGTAGDGADAVTIDDGQNGVAVDYAGTPLVPGQDFSCGDVIEIRLVQIGTGAADGNFALQILVHPGR